MQVRIILVGTQHAENLAAILRSARAFGVTDIWLVNPAFSLNEVEGRIARRGKDLLKQVRITEKLDEAIGEADIILAGSAKDAPGRNLLREYLPLREAFKHAVQVDKIALVFGREDTGLTDDELRKADLIYTIPTMPPQRALNLAHAVSITLYEYAMQASRTTKRLPVASHSEREVLLHRILGIVQKVNEIRMHPNRAARLRVQHLVWHRLLGRSMPSEIDIRTLLGFFADIERIVDEWASLRKGKSERGSGKDEERTGDIREKRM